MNCLKSIRSLVLWLTNDCNLRCRYCYANAGEKKEYMSFETARKAIDRARVGLGGFCGGEAGFGTGGVWSGPLKFQLAGGEPLLNLELIRRIYKYIKEEGIPAVLQMQTNGTLITYETAKELKRMNIALGVSLDGGAAVNEALRGRSGDVIEGIRRLAQAGINVNLNCVLAKQNVKYLPDLVDMAFYFGNVRGIGLDLLRKTGRALQNQLEAAGTDEIRTALRAAYERAQQLYGISGKKIILREVEEARKRLAAGVECKGYCYASLGSAMVVLPDGSAYPCGSLAGRQEYLMGNIMEGELKMIRLEINKSQSCKACRYETICPGGCPSRMIANWESNTSTQDCALRRTAFEIAESEMSE